MDTQLIRTKLKLTPLPIRSWFASEEVSLMVQVINKHFNIQDQNRTILPELLLRLEAKDLEPDYFAGELSTELKIDRDKALGISSEVKRTILGPMNKDFSDIGIDISLLDKFQIPIIKGLTPSAATGDAPKIIQDINSSTTATSQSTNAIPTLKTTAIPNAKIPPAAISPQTNRLSDIGWSKSRTADPVVKLDISQIPVSAPKPVIPEQHIPAAPQQPIAPTNHSLGEFERLNAMKKGPSGASTSPSPTTPTSTPPAPSTPAAPAPFILHQDTSFSAVSKNADFKISQPQANADMHLSEFKGQSPAPRPAVLEIGQVSKSPVQSPASSAIHYTEFKPSLSTVPTQNSGPRQVSQIMAPATPTTPPVPRPPQAPQPPTASGMPRVPMPPTPPQTQSSTQPKKEQVIVKDFL